MTGTTQLLANLARTYRRCCQRHSARRTPVVQTTGLDINATATFLTGNVGGGVKWYRGKRWGLCADYRFLTVQSQNDAPAFFGQTTRYGHRVYGGVVLNALR